MEMLFVVAAFVALAIPAACVFNDAGVDLLLENPQPEYL